ncbi:hypothetical protein CAL14_12000 [Bordetella genomosp. 9]|uniref:hypothetical protein n=1 Tax=Bordetella genomosp. 9 TaxID=1416803 RepID=UPI000A295E73|nr:hypothetical protein [Bordetella genomosp. 9]ARP90924.1 hypothetical protein CAL14_12000 [Bordetella genomosp. 9]
MPTAVSPLASAAGQPLHNRADQPLSTRAPDDLVQLLPAQRQPPSTVAAGDATMPRHGHAIYENRRWRRDAPDARPATPPDSLPPGQPRAEDPWIAACRAGPVDTAYWNGRLEDDDALMVRLATASGGYAGTPSAADLTPAKRRELAVSLIRALTAGIDWQVSLGQAPNATAGIYFDGLTLRNASGKPMAGIVQELEARIAGVLQACGTAQLAGLTDCAGLARQVRRMMTSDPTLSLQPPPDVAYGSPRWVTLWTGMQTLADQGLSPHKVSTDDLVAVGRAAIAVQTRKSPRPAGSTTPPGVDIGALLLMAHAAGRIDLRRIAQEAPDSAADGAAAALAPEDLDRLTSFLKEIMADELRILDAIAGLKPPTGRELAADNLRAAGLDPEHRIDVRSVVIPAAFGPVRFKIPLPFAFDQQALADVYVSHETLDLSEDAGDPALSAPVSPEVSRARTKLGRSLKDEFDAAFDRYKTTAASHIATLIDASVARYGSDHGIDFAGATITVTRAQRVDSLHMPVVPGVGQGLLAVASASTERTDANGYFVSIDTSAGRHRYFVALSDGAEYPLPPERSIEDWAASHGEIVFGTAVHKPDFPGSLFNDLTYPLTTLATGKREEIGAQLNASLPGTLERSRAALYGASEVETIRGIERGLIPFYSTYSAIKDGRTEDIAWSLALDVLIFVPALGEGLSLGMRAGEALMAGLSRAVSETAGEGLLQAIKLGVAESGRFAPALMRQAGKTLGAVAHSAVIDPRDLLKLLRGGARLGNKGLRAVARSLKTSRPELAQALIEAARKMSAGGARYRPLPAGMLRRYRISDPGLIDTLSKAARSDDGTIMLGAKRYAEVEGNYLALTADHAASTQERPVWRIAGAGLPGTRQGGVRLVWDADLGRWQEAKNVPQLKGGGSTSASASTSASGSASATPAGTQLTRVKVADDAVAALDRDVPADAPNHRGDYDNWDNSEIYEYSYTGRLANTETVELAVEVLEEANDITQYAWWESEFDDFFDMEVVGLETSAYAEIDPRYADPETVKHLKITMTDRIRTFLTDLYARSETFRALVNRARSEGYIAKDDKWTIQIQPPDALSGGLCEFAEEHGADYEDRIVRIPDLQAPPQGLQDQMLADGYTWEPYLSPATIIHELIHVLTRRSDPAVDLWKDEASHLVHGFPERGVVEYLTQRVLKESGIQSPRQLTYLSYTSEGQANLARVITPEKIAALQRYVDMQDDYLLRRFPQHDPNPATPWNPSAGNERWLTADSLGSGSESDSGSESSSGSGSPEPMET